MQCIEKTFKRGGVITTTKTTATMGCPNGGHPYNGCIQGSDTMVINASKYNR